MTNPIQPLAKDADGVMRFKENAIVRHLYDWAQPRGMGLNELAMMPFSEDDRQQFAQLIGYSLSGYSELSYVSDEAYGAAVKMADGLSEDKARIAALEHQLGAMREAADALRDAIAEPLAVLLRMHPDDLRRL